MVDELNDFTIVDTPGYDDTKGYLQEIKGAFSTHDVLCSSKKEANAKILIVVRAGEIGSKRSKGVQDLLARFDSMFPNLTESEKGAVGLVITCEEMGKPVKEYINKLNRKDSTQITKKWCEYFINHPEQQFVFPAATEDMENKTFDFDDKNRLKEFIQKGQFIVPHPNLSLGKDSILYLENGFLSHTSDLLNEADKIVKCITDIYKQITKGEDLNKWSNKIKNISQMKISSPGILLDLIQNNFSDNKSKFVDSIEKLEDLDALHSFFVDVLKINDDKIDDEIKKPIDNKITKLISEFNTYKDSINKKELAERMEKAKEEAERQKQEEENRRKREVAEERRRRYEAEQESRRIREEENRRRREEENQRRREEENRRRIEAENQRMREEEKLRKKFQNDNNIIGKPVHEKTKPKLDSGKVFYIDEDEKEGICYHLTESRMFIESNSVMEDSSPYNVIRPSQKYKSKNVENTYLKFNFIRRKVKIDKLRIQNTRNDKYCLINFEVLGSNDNIKWDKLMYNHESDGTTPREAYATWYTIYHPNVDDYKLYYQYIKIEQTGPSYNCGGMHYLEIDEIEFFGKYSEPRSLK